MAKRYIFLQLCGRKNKEYDIGSLIEKNRTYLLNLSQSQSLYADFKEFDLNAFPLPALLFLAVIQLYFLHGGNKLYQAAFLFSGCLSNNLRT